MIRRTASRGQGLANRLVRRASVHPKQVPVEVEYDIGNRLPKRQMVCGVHQEKYNQNNF